MTAMLVHLTLPLLFVGSAAMAMTALVMTWRTYGRELARLRAELAACPDLREFEGRVATTRVREFTSGVRREAIRTRGGPGPARRAAGRRAAA